MALHFDISNKSAVSKVLLNRDATATVLAWDKMSSDNLARNTDQPFYQCLPFSRETHLPSALSSLATGLRATGDKLRNMEPPPSFFRTLFRSR